MRAKIGLGMILLSFLPALVYAQNQHQALVQELYAKSGMEKQLELLPLTIQAGLDQPLLEGDQQAKPPQQVFSLLKALAPEAFAPESLKAVVLPELRAKLTTHDLKTLLKWLDSPLGAKITQLEEEASTPEAVAETEKYKAQLKNSPPTPERLKIIRKLDGALKATKSTVETVISTQVALALAINATLPREQQRPLAEISRELEKHRPEIEAAMKLETLVFLLYTYRDLTESEIQQYVKFLGSPAGAKFNTVADAALQKALFEGGIRWGKAVGEAMKQVNSQSEA